MTPEGRIDRIERITKLFARAGRRARGDLRSQDEKINILINLHIENEERFAKNEERFTKLDVKLDEKFALVLNLHAQNEERFRQNEERIARTEEKFVELAESQADSNRRLDSLIEIVRKDRNGNS